MCRPTLQALLCQHELPLRLRDSACSVLVLKKLGNALLEEFVSVIKYLHSEERLNIIVERHMHQELVRSPCRPASRLQKSQTSTQQRHRLLEAQNAAQSTA